MKSRRRLARVFPAPFLILALLGPAGCQGAPAPGSPGALVPAGTGRVALSPVYRAGLARALFAVVTPYTVASINHMVIKIFTWDGSTEALQGTLDIQAADLLNTITFGNLKNNTTYRIRAYAYKTAGTGDPISVDASSFLDVAVGADDRPVLGNLVVQLADIGFSGEATATGITVTPGTITYPTAVGVVLHLPSGVTTLAGSASLGFVDGTGGGAALENPADVATGPDNHLYVADRANHAIRRISPGGVVATLAGNGTLGSADGTGAGARFNAPEGIAVDSAGNVYVADTQNNLIRKITSGGLVSTLAGSGAAAFADGTGNLASFSGPSGLAIDSATGMLYVADAGNRRIRKVTAGGVVTTFAGSGASGALNATGTAATFREPRGLALLPGGDLVVADRLSHLVRRITPGAVVTTLAGDGTAGSGDATGLAASFNLPTGLAIVPASGAVVVTDQGSHRVRQIDTGAVVTTVAGSSAGFTDTATFSNVKFNLPAGLAVLAGDLYVADLNNHRIRRVVSPVAL